MANRKLYWLTIVLLCLSLKVSGQFLGDSKLPEFTGRMQDTARVLSFLEKSKFALNEHETYAESKAYADSAYRIASEIPWKKGLILHWNMYGLISRAKSRYVDAIEYHTVALDLAKELGDVELEAVCLNNIAVAWCRTDNHQQAIHFHAEALKTADKAGKMQTKMYAINGLGNSYLAIRNYDEAKKQFEQALKLAYKLENDESQAINLNNLGDVCYEQENYSEALDFFKRSLNINIENNNREGILITQISVGKAFSRMKNYIESAKYFNLALETNLVTEKKLYSAVAVLELAYTQIQLKNFDGAELLLTEGLALAREIDSKQNIALAYQNFSELYKQKNDFKKAYLYQIQFNLLKDSLISEEIQQNTFRMQVNFELDQNKKQILFLEKDKENQRIRASRQLLITVISGILILAATVILLMYRMFRSKAQSNVQLLKLLSEKEILLAEVHHRVKNNLALIAGLVQLQMENKHNPVEKQALEEIYSRVFTFSLIYENLYDSGDFEAINFGNFLKKYFLNSNYDLVSGHIDISIDASDVLLPLKTAVPLALICNELITNSYKHAFIGNQNGIIEISLKKNEFDAKTWQLRIADNGIGMANQPKVFETTGFSIISLNISQLNGEFNIVTGYRKGFEFSLSFEISE